jgi:hypothetical protein
LHQERHLKRKLNNKVSTGKLYASTGESEHEFYDQDESQDVLATHLSFKGGLNFRALKEYLELIEVKYECFCPGGCLKVPHDLRLANGETGTYLSGI